MLEIANFNDNFFDCIEKEKRRLVVYGAGTASKIAFPFFPKVDFFCDKHAQEIQEINGVKVISLKELAEIKDLCYVLVCVNKKESTFQKICETFERENIHAKIFNYFYNCAFDCFHPLKPYEVKENRTALRVRLVSYDTGWILEKFALKLEAELKMLGVNVDIAKCCDPNADINHHISHHKYEPIQDCNDTLMITHVDCLQKIELLKHQLKLAKMGICMSKDTLNKLAQLGIPREKLCYINPGQDEIMSPKKYVLGITHKTHVDMDYRKNPRIIVEICRHISPQYFSFKIMGAGWAEIVSEIRELGFGVEHYNDFDYDEYLKLMPSLDYYLYYGNDEGSMGFLDAIKAGVKTIVTPQGYHLDVKGGITYPCETVSDFVEALQTIQNERKKIVESVQNWTWKEYAKKHLDVWNYLTQREELSVLLKEQHYHSDGIFSVLLNDVAI